MRIVAVKEDDELLSGPDNRAHESVAPRKVDAKFAAGYSSVISVKVDGHIIRTTPKHRFFVWDRGWVAAIALRVGDPRSHDGKRPAVEAVIDTGE